MRPTDFRKEFARAYGGPRAQRHGTLTPDLLRLASATLRGACLRLLLPRLGLRERARLLPADGQGLHELMLALSQTLAAFPDLARTLGLTPGVMAELQAKDVELLTALERADAIMQGAGHAERAAVARLKELCARVLSTAARLRDNPGDQGAADEAADLLAVVARFELRIQRTQRRRLQRLRRRELALAEAAGPGSSLPASSGEDGEDGEDAAEPHAPDEDPTAGLAPEIQGEPLEGCLRAPLAAFREVNAQLAELAQLVETRKDEAPAEAPEDLLYYIELGAHLSSALHLSPRVQAACQVEPAAFSTLGAQADDSALLAGSCRLFTRMAADGRLFVSAFTLQLYEQAVAWLQGRAEAGSTWQAAPDERFQVEALRLQQVRGRATERQADRKARAERKVKAAAAKRRAGANVSPGLDRGGTPR
jgi:hypothetical protein